jgi:predicted DNA repair protein MutK
MKPIMDWLSNAFAAAIVGLIIGIVLVVIVRQITSHPEELIVD